MFPLSRALLTLAAASTLVTLVASSTPATAEDSAQNLGPVGPREPMLAVFGNKRIIAFFVPANGGCDVQAVLWNRTDTDAGTAAGFRVRLDPGQSASIDSVDNETLTLRCGDYAESLTATGNEHQVASK